MIATWFFAFFGNRFDFTTRTPEYVFVVPADVPTMVVDGDDVYLSAPADDVTMVVPGDQVTMTVPADNWILVR